MKWQASFLIAMAIFISGIAYAQVKIPAPSPTQTIKQDFALGNIEITYSRPSAKGRLVFGGLVPFGKLWRTGANKATIIKFSDIVYINGKKIDSGAYALYSIPGEEEWEIILNKGITNWGTTNYKESDDVVRIKVPTKKNKNNIEDFTIQFANILPESCDIQLIWQKTQVEIPLTSPIKNRIRTQIEQAMNTDKKPYYLAAQFYYEYDKNYTKALENISNAVKENPKAYYMWLYKAKIEKEMGNKAAAKISSQTSLSLATEQKNDDYIKLNEDFLKKL
ncbi:MAG: DUF2911 domain-containing protein [Bacteroidetes bacterium]|nr:DUF2911 domain-containing protein [Bacteroidota bacterium]MBS1756904.1 DUF2911 domain-containing protein [Bacteroidota bacterium]